MHIILIKFLYLEVIRLPNLFLWDADKQLQRLATLEKNQVTIQLLIVAIIIITFCNRADVVIVDWLLSKRPLQRRESK